MIKSSVLLVVLLILMFGCAQKKTASLPQDASVDCIAHWKKNDSIRLKITREKRSSDKKGNESPHYYATIKVMDTLSDGYLLSWQNIPPIKMGNQSLPERMANLFLNLRIIYSTDKKGSFNTIENYDEMQAVVEASIKEISESMAANTDKNVIDKQMQQMRDMFAGKDMVNQLLGRDIQTFHSVYGGTFKARPDTTITSNSAPFDPSRSFPAILISVLKTLDNKKQEAGMLMVQHIDPKEATKVMNDFLLETYRKSGHEPSPEETITKYMLSDSSTYTYQLSSGWITYLYSQRNLETENSAGQVSQQTLITTIELRH